MAYVEAAITYNPGLNCVFCMGHFRPHLSALWNGSKMPYSEGRWFTVYYSNYGCRVRAQSHLCRFRSGLSQCINGHFSIYLWKRNCPLQNLHTAVSSGNEP